MHLAQSQLQSHGFRIQKFPKSLQASEVYLQPARSLCGSNFHAKLKLITASSNGVGYVHSFAKVPIFVGNTTQLLVMECA